MTRRTANILVVDDQEMNINIIKKCLKDEDYIIESALDGDIAIKKIEEHPDKFDVILLDRMMPNMNGLEVLRRIKSCPELEHLPVIMQTAMAGKEEMLEGIEAGAYYYLTKPFARNELLSITRTAAHDSILHRNLREELQGTLETFQLMSSGTFNFKTIAEASSLATLLAKCFPRPQKVISGLRELFINAVEHGNLDISYDEKTKLTESFTWEKEIDRRLNLPENRGKFVNVDFERDQQKVRVIVTDQGKGFSWQDYLEVSPERISDNHGRGIAMAKALSFSFLDYPGCGNVVIAGCDLEKADR